MYIIEVVEEYIPVVEYKKTETHHPNHYNHKQHHFHRRHNNDVTVLNRLDKLIFYQQNNQFNCSYILDCHPSSKTTEAISLIFLFFMGFFSCFICNGRQRKLKKQLEPI